MTDQREPLRVFVSYAHENPQHKENVLVLATILRKRKMKVFLDRWHKIPRIDWNQTITNHIREADFVLAVVSDRYRAAAEGKSPNGVNLGVQHELAIIRELLNSDRSTWLPKIIPVILPGWEIDDVPTVLQPTTASHCRVTDVTEQGMKDLLELLTPDGDSLVMARPRAISVVRDRITKMTSRPSTLFTSAAVTAAIAVGIVTMVDFGGSITQNLTASGTGNAITQVISPCGQVVNSSCAVELKEDVDRLSEAASSDDELKAELAKEAKAGPTGEGPWPFMVVDALDPTGVDLGLYARSTNRLEATRLGTSANRTLVWADCVATSDYTPKVDTMANMGPQWLYVHWTPVEPTQRGTSEPDGTEHAWMYRGGLVPVKHNGDIPRCP